MVVSAGTGCKDSTEQTVTVYPKPFADFSIPANTCAPDTINVVNTSQYKGQATFSWSASSPTVWISDPTSAAPSFGFIDNQSGFDSVYTMTLIVTSVDGCTDTVNKTITVYSRPVASFSMPPAACTPLAVVPTNSSTGVSLSYTWTVSPTVGIVGPNSASPTISFPVTQNDSVVYQIRLTITDSRGCQDEKGLFYTVYPKPTADFIPSIADSCGPVTVFFTNTSLSGQTGFGRASMSFSWDFGNGATSIDSTDSATFTNNGVLDSVYTVTLIATNVFGCSDTIQKTITVRPNPKAEFTPIIDTECAPFTIDSSKLSVMNYPNANSNYTWRVINPQTLNVLQTFTGINSLNYTMVNQNDSVLVRLIVTGSYGCKGDSIEHTFRTIPNPVPGFIMTPSVGCNPLTISVTDTSSVGVTHEWFVDGVLRSTAANPSFILQNTSPTMDSVFEIKLVVSAGTGCKDSTFQNATVYALPNTQFSYDAACFGDSTSFFDQSIIMDSIVTWFWDFGDGSFDSIPSPKHLYSTWGAKWVTLTVVDSRGCSKSYSDSIPVFPNPIADFYNSSTCGIDTVCLNQAFALIDNSNVLSLGAPISGWQWDIGNDGNVDYTLQNPLHSFLDTGFVDVKLKVITIYGCVDSIVKSIYVTKPPTPLFVFDTISNCGPLDVSLIASSIGDLQSYLWEFYVEDNLGNKILLLNDTSRLPPVIPTLIPSNINDTTYFFSLTVGNCCGTQSLVKTITLKPMPVAGMLASTLVGCTPLPVTFQLDGLVQGNPDFLVINYGDGSKIDTLYLNFIVNTFGDTVWFWGQQNHVFVNPTLSDTTYNVTLTAYGECGDSTVTLSILVRPNSVQAFFQATPVAGCSPLTVQFQDFSFGGTNKSWCLDYDINSGVCNQPVASGSIIIHTFNFPGVYNIAFFIDDGCSFDTAIQQINVYPSPIASLSHNNLICQGDTIQFFSQSSISAGLINYYLWDFGDGNFSTLTNPSHIYTSGGTFNVKLIVGSSNGCQDSAFSQVTIFDNPEIKFFANDACINEQPIQFIDSSQVIYGQINSTIWDFGDGNSSIALNPSHSYASPGSYIVKLVHSSSNGCIDSASKTINVYPIPTAQFNFSRVSLDSCSTPQTIQFSNQSIDAQGFYWDFDYFNNPGVNTSTLNNPVYQYNNFGVFHVALFTTNQYGCKDSIIHPIYVRPAPIASFSVDSTKGCQPLRVQFTDNSIYGFSGGNITSWFWDFGDGSTSNTQNPLHIYINHGIFTVKLYVTTDGGCTDSVILERLIEVFPTPIVNFEMLKINPVRYQFINNTQNTDSSTIYFWDFGDGTTSNERNPTHQYLDNLQTSSVTYRICLKVVNGLGCEDENCKTLNLDLLVLNVPNAFAPESESGFDGDVFLPKGNNLKDYLLTIYDKFGNIVFQTNKLNEEGIPIEGWDGNHYKNGIPLPMGSYTWKIDAVFKDGSVWLGKEYKNSIIKNVGSVTLLR